MVRQVRPGGWFVWLALTLGAAAPSLLSRPASAQSLEEGAHAEAQRHFAKARELYGQGNYRDARLELLEAKRLDPTSKELVFNLGIVDEKLALEGRAGYYDKNGALKDMIQSHLLQVMALTAMEEVSSIDALEVRDLIVHTLRATQLWTGDPVTSSRRARYRAGRIDDRDIPDYAREEGVDPSRNTETLAEVDLRINNSRWAGVKFTLRSGKALGDERNGITVVFKPVAHSPSGFRGDAPVNVLLIGLKPQTLALQLSTNGAGDKFDLEETVLAADLGDSALRPYGEILEFLFAGNPILSVRADVAEECWRIVEPVLDAWAAGTVPLYEYTAGSAGPAEFA